MFVLETPHRPARLPATPENIQAVLADLVGRPDPYLIVSAGEELTYMQTLWSPSGFVLEFQEGSVDRHFATVREDLTATEVASALEAYVRGHDSGWRRAFFFRQKDVRSPAYITGFRLGQMLRRWVIVLVLVLCALLLAWFGR